MNQEPTQKPEKVVYLKPYVDFRQKPKQKKVPWWKFWASRPVGGQHE